MEAYKPRIKSKTKRMTSGPNTPKNKKFQISRNTMTTFNRT